MENSRRKFLVVFLRRKETGEDMKITAMMKVTSMKILAMTREVAKDSSMMEVLRTAGEILMLEISVIFRRVRGEIAIIYSYFDVCKRTKRCICEIISIKW